MLDWLTPISAEKQHQDVENSQDLNPKAGWWLVDRDSPEPNATIFREWRDEWKPGTELPHDEQMPDAFAAMPPANDGKTLLLLGFPEVGKTVIALIIIKHLQHLRSCFKNAKPNGICYSYLGMMGPLGTREMPARVLRTLLRTLVCDLKTIPEEVMDLYEKHDRNSTSPADSEVFNCLYTICEKYHDKVYVVIDALDEHKDPDRETLITYLKRLPDNTKVFATSRDIGAIKAALAPTWILQHRAHKKDIRLYLEHQVGQNRSISNLLRRVSANSNRVSEEEDLRHQMEEAVISNADHSYAIMSSTAAPQY